MSEKADPASKPADNNPRLPGGEVEESRPIETPPHQEDRIHGRDQMDSVRNTPSTRAEAQQTVGRGSRNRD